MADKLDEIFERQKALQDKYGHKFDQMSGEELAEYIRWNVLACNDELHEALGEVNWKPWLTTPLGMHDRDKFVGELRDALQFLLNLMMSVGVTPDELAERMASKIGQNHRRIVQYDGRTDKCAYCKRALDEPGIDASSIIKVEEKMYCGTSCALTDAASAL